MASIKEEAKKALKAAEERFKAHDLKGARRLALQAEALFPSLPGLPQALAAYDVHIASGRRSQNTAGIDWYAVLGIDPSAGHDTIKKQYKKMCILTHPDKNPSAAADGAFKFVMQAWTVLSVVCPSDPRASQQPGSEAQDSQASASSPCPPCPASQVTVDCHSCGRAYTMYSTGNGLRRPSLCGYCKQFHRAKPASGRKSSHSRVGRGSPVRADGVASSRPPISSWSTVTCPDCLKEYTVSCVEGWWPLVCTCGMQSTVRVFGVA